MGNDQVDAWGMWVGKSARGAVLWSVLALVAGCGSNDKAGAKPGAGGGDAAAAGTSNAGNSATGGTSDASGGSGNDSAGTMGGTGATSAGAAGADPGVDPPAIAGDGTELEPGADGGGFDGVTLTGTDFVREVTGCSAFDPNSGELALTLDAKAPSVVLRVSGGSVTANGKVCASSDGKTKATADRVTSIHVTGGDEDSFAVVDGGSAFGKAMLAAGNGFQFALGGGTDLLVVLGSTGADEVRLGSDGETVVVDFNGDLVPDIRATGADQVIVSTGPMPDKILGDGVDLGLDPVAVPMKLYGGGANDLLLGGKGDDELSGGIGNDTLLAGRDPGGADLFVGGDGEDFVDYAGRTAAVSVTLASGADDGEADEHDQVDESVENVRGGSGDDHLTGSSEANKLWGGDGDDVLVGGNGDDSLYGGDGDDQLDGQEGNDALYGEGGDDILVGGNGDDLLDGYPGTNTLDGGGGDADICVPTKSDTATACEL